MGNSDSFFIKIDNGQDYYWDIKDLKHWHWAQAKSQGRDDPVGCSLTEGEHIIKVRLREAGTKLDRMLLTNNMVFVPVGKRGISEN